MDIHSKIIFLTFKQMASRYIVTRKNPPTYAFTVWYGDFTEEEKQQFEKIVEQEKISAVRSDVKTWEDIYQIEDKYFTIGRTKGHRVYLEHFTRAYGVEEYIKDIHTNIN